MDEFRTWRKRGRHFDRVFTMDVIDDTTAITIHAIGELARLVRDVDEEQDPILLPAAEVERMLTLAGYTREDTDG